MTIRIYSATFTHIFVTFWRSSDRVILPHLSLLVAIPDCR